MKIILVTDAIYPFTVGGSEIRNYEILKRLSKKGHEVNIYGTKFWEGKDVIKIDGIKIYGISKFDLYNESGKRNPFNLLKFSVKIFFKLIKEDFDLIDNATFNYFNCYTTKLASIIKNKPLIFTWHQYFGDYLIGYFGSFKGNIAKLLEKRSLKLTNFNIAVSDFVKNDLIQNGIDKDYVDIIYNGVDLKYIKKIKDQEKKFDLLFVGRLNYQKNVELLIKSVYLLKKKFPNINVCIIGHGSEERYLKNLVFRYNLNKNIKFVGEIKNRKKIFEYMKSSKIFVLPSRLEGFPLVFLEASACGLPIITTNTRENKMRFFIKDNGILSDPIPSSLADSISNLLKDKIKMKFMSEQSTLLSVNFEWDKIAEKTEKYYNYVTEKHYLK